MAQAGATARGAGLKHSTTMPRSLHGARKRLPLVNSSERKAEGKPLGTVPHGSYTLVKTPGGYTALKPRIKPKSA